MFQILFRTRKTLPLTVLTFLAFFGIMLGVAATGCTQSSKAVRNVTASETYGMIRNDFAVMVDVREADEVADGMAEPARWFPTSKIREDSPEWKEFVAKLPKDKEIVLYCAKGGRAGKAAELLSAQGFKTANMGGFSEWAKAGMPVRKP